MTAEKKPPALGADGANLQPMTETLSGPPLPVMRQPAGRWAENRPNPSGQWLGPAPHFMPCKTCGELTHILGWCARCRAWDAYLKARAAGDREQASYWIGMFRRAGGAA